jgi:kinesin family protein 2/24
VTQIYNNSVKPLVDSAFQGANVTCFAYGQTGSGKTFTMIGDVEKNVEGLYMLASKEIFAKIGTQKYHDVKVYISFYEIYCGKLFDLLNGRKNLVAREDGKQVVDFRLV